jgi:hypothetical protein
MAAHEAFALKMFGIDPGWRRFNLCSSKSRLTRRRLADGLMHAQAAEIVAVREESDIRDKTAVEGPHRCGPLRSIAGG